MNNGAQCPDCGNFFEYLVDDGVCEGCYEERLKENK